MDRKNSFNYLYELIDTQVKNIFKLMYKIILLEIKNKISYITNELFSKWKKIQKPCV